MITQELYIDGVLADMDDNSSVWLDIKTNLLNDITKIQSSVTLTIKLPTTQCNKRIIGLGQVVTQRAGEDTEWRVHDAEYRRNGVTLIRGGRLTVVGAGDDSIDCTIVWGLYDAVARLTKADVALNGLTENINTLLWTGNDSPDTYVAAQAADYFFAGADMWYTTAQDYPWEVSDSVYVGEHDKRFRGRVRGTCLHPSVKVSYVLGLIAQYCNVTINWSQAAQTIINSMVIPLVDNKANEQTYRDTTVVSFPQKAKTERTLGLFTPTYVAVDSAVFRQDGGDNNPLRALVDGDIHAEISCTVQYDMTGWATDAQGYWKMRGVYCAIVVEHGENDREYYRCGLRYVSETSIKASDYPSNIVEATLTGEGVFAVRADDKVYFARYYQQSNFGGSNTDPVVSPANDNPPTVFLSGVAVNMRPANIDGEVPPNGYYPIESNLPDIKVVDFVKFLAAYTGSFPLQIASDSVITFASLSDVFGNMSNAVDWSSRLIAGTGENVPKALSFHPTEWAQINRYEWAEDDRNMESAASYGMGLLLDDDTLEKERVILTFPFAASDNDRVPCYTLDGEGKTAYSACKPRIMRLYDNGGQAAMIFDDGWADRLAASTELLRRSLEHAKIITERIDLSDIEIMRFDERKPVYLAQYGAYFAVLEIKQSNEMAADVTMLRIIQ